MACCASNSAKSRANSPASKLVNAPQHPGPVKNSFHVHPGSVAKPPAACLHPIRFNLRYGYKPRCIETYVDKKHDNNISILDLGLPSVTPMELRQLSEEVIKSTPDEVLRDILIYADTQLAHFTKDEHQPDLKNLFDACQLVEEGILRFVYDRAALPRPIIQGKS